MFPCVNTSFNHVNNYFVLSEEKMLKLCERYFSVAAICGLTNLSYKPCASLDMNHKANQTAGYLSEQFFLRELANPINIHKS
jgi:hypothetical protein